jgi:hypothetical protein
MKQLVRQAVLYALLCVPISAVSFAAKSALKLGGENGTKFDKGTILAGEKPSVGALWKNNQGTA